MSITALLDASVARGEVAKTDGGQRSKAEAMDIGKHLRILLLRI